MFEKDEGLSAADAGFGEDDGEGGAGAVVGGAAEVVHAEDVVGEGGACWVGVVARPWRS